MTPAPSPRLLPCPFCGSADSLFVNGSEFVECHKCYAFGPDTDESRDPAASWNARAAGDVNRELVTMLRHIYDTQSYYRNEERAVVCDLDMVRDIKALLDSAAAPARATPAPTQEPTK